LSALGLGRAGTTKPNNGEQDQLRGTRRVKFAGEEHLVR